MVGSIFPADGSCAGRRSAERRFLGFDAYKKTMECLRPGDIVLLTTPFAFRWVHFSHAIDKGLNVFMEKPTTVDGPSTSKMLALAERSVRKNLKVGVGLMCRHCDARKALLEHWGTVRSARSPTSRRTGWLARRGSPARNRLMAFRRFRPGKPRGGPPAGTS